MSVRLSARIKQFGSHWTDFHEIGCLSFFLKSIEKIKCSVKSGTLPEDQHKFLIKSHSLLLAMRNEPDKRCRENQNTHFPFN
jgi:hypothetical protein